MRKLRLKKEEWEEMLKDISRKFHKDCKMNITTFEYTKADINKFLNTTVAENVKKPTILIYSNIYTKMYELVKQSSIEIQWHMLVKRFPETQEYLVYDVLLFPQTNSGASTTTDQNEFAKWQLELIKDMTFPIEHLRGHGHSHVNMNVYSSSIDDAYQRDLITKVEDGDYYLFLVLNKKMEMYALLYDFEQQIIFETKDMDIKIIDDNGEDIIEWCKEQIEKNCKTFVPKYRDTTKYAPPSSLKLDSYKPENEELISEIKEKSKNFTKRRR